MLNLVGFALRKQATEFTLKPRLEFALVTSGYATSRRKFVNGFAFFAAVAAGLLSASCSRKADPQPRVEVPVGVIDFGNGPPRTTVTGTIRLENIGDAPLLVSGTRASCACTSLEPAGPFSVPAGEARHITAAIRLETEGESRSAVVSISTNDPTRPTAQVEIVATSPAFARPVPQVINFGDVHTGDGSARHLEVWDTDKNTLMSSRDIEITSDTTEVVVDSMPSGIWNVRLAPHEVNQILDASLTIKSRNNDRSIVVPVRASIRPSIFAVPSVLFQRDLRPNNPMTVIVRRMDRKPLGKFKRADGPDCYRFTEIESASKSEQLLVRLTAVSTQQPHFGDELRYSLWFDNCDIPALVLVRTTFSHH